MPVNGRACRLDGHTGSNARGQDGNQSVRCIGALRDATKRQCRLTNKRYHVWHLAVLERDGDNSAFASRVSLGGNDVAGRRACAA